eukprot:6059798-Pleurochrysis_carterae.AAC.1
MALVAQTGSSAITDHDLDATVCIRVSSKVNNFSGQIHGATGNASRTHTAESVSLSYSPPMPGRTVHGQKMRRPA